MTPYELRIHAEIFSEKQQFEQEERISLVWLAERFRRFKELPPLKEVLGKQEEKTKEMTAEEMLQKVMQLNGALGGTVQEVGE